LVLAHANFVNAMTHSNGSPMYFFYQQASFNNALDVSAFKTTNRFVGVTCEGCISTWATPVRTNMYAPVLNEMAAVNASSGAYLLISHGNSFAGSATQILQRLVTTGIVWLGYSEGHTIVEPNLETNTKKLAIWPEDLIYPSSPLQSMNTSSNDLLVAPGVFRREFASCYQQGVLFGPCAIVVNANATTVTIQPSWLHQTYQHVMTVSGGDVLSGGVANISGATFIAGSTWVQAGGAIFLTR
jgi:hypothetical protein